MKTSALCKFSIACAVLCAVLCGVSVSPLVFALILAVFTLLCMLVSAVIYIAGFFVFLFSAFQVNIWDFAGVVGGFGINIFGLVDPVMNFSLQYLTPIVGWVAFGFGVMGIIVSSVGISRANKQAAQEEVHSEPIVAPADTTATVAEAPANNGKKIKKKKKKTEKGAYIATLVVSIVFMILALIAAIVCIAIKMQA